MKCLCLVAVVALFGVAVAFPSEGLNTKAGCCNRLAKREDGKAAAQKEERAASCCGKQKRESCCGANPPEAHRVARDLTDAEGHKEQKPGCCGVASPQMISLAVNDTEGKKGKSEEKPEVKSDAKTDAKSEGKADAKAPAPLTAFPTDSPKTPQAKSPLTLSKLAAVPGVNKTAQPDSSKKPLMTQQKLSPGQQKAIDDLKTTH